MRKLATIAAAGAALTAVVAPTIVVILMASRQSFAAEADSSPGRAKFVLCAACHGGDGRSGALPEYPKIAGQNRKYLVNALQAYKAGRRVGTFAALMSETAKNLSDADIELLADFVAGLDDEK